MPARGNMSSLMAMSLGDAVGDQPTTKQLDWKKAKELIVEQRDLINRVDAGLMEDWGATCGTIFSNNQFCEDSWGYFASKWATPIALFVYKDGSEKEVECWEIVKSEDSIPKMPEDWTTEPGDEVIVCEAINEPKQLENHKGEQGQ